LSEKGKKASELTATSFSFLSHSSRSSGVKSCGTVSKFLSKSSRSTPDLGTWPEQRRSMALLGAIFSTCMYVFFPDGLPFVWSLDALFELQVQRSFMETHPPVICLVASKPRAVNSRLLASAEPDDLTFKGIAYRV
jgi:hypothetical protein